VVAVNEDAPSSDPGALVDGRCGEAVEHGCVVSVKAADVASLGEGAQAVAGWCADLEEAEV